ncbi:hypothetical protein B0H12DRAFT_1123348 [Mycena haematopus]|nr:hypothetical protein B0H12DRAFT_1123348 [Mycena haematopus]
MPTKTRSSFNSTAQTADVVLLSDVVPATKRTTARKDHPKQNPARKENHWPVNSGEIIEISSDEDDEPVAPRVSAVGTSKLQARIRQLEQENARIKKENDEIKKQQSSAAADLEDQITCEVCSAKLWTPYILSCGHTFCAQDLENWFSTALKQHRTVYPLYNVHHAPNVYNMYQQQLPLPPYTCPKCRERVCTRPVQNFAVKGLVRAVAGQMGETSPKKTADANVWNRFFPA